MGKKTSGNINPSKILTGKADKNPLWENYLNPLSKKVLDMRADSSGTRSVGSARRKKEGDIAAQKLAESQRAAAQAAFDAKYAGRRPPSTFPGGSSSMPAWGGPKYYNPNLRLRRDPFADALIPKQPVGTQ